ncbi:hypothetical protein [Ancylobacter gelatini]|nr:hypothetical protein [Ancylobacter gelatini]
MAENVSRPKLIFYVVIAIVGLLAFWIIPAMMPGPFSSPADFR